MRDKISYKSFDNHLCEDGARRNVHIKGTYAPFYGWMALPDTYFSCDAYIYRHGKRVRGYVTPADNEQEFREFKQEAKQ